MNNKSHKGLVRRSLSEGGFTLIEILVVIGMIALLAAIVLIAINPARQFAQGRNSQRHNDTSAILNAIGQYIADNKGAIPSGITTTDTEIKNGGADLCSILVPTYLSALPVDPSTGGTVTSPCPATYTTNYYVVRDASNRITVRANGAELSQTISITR